jgi:ribosomal protein L11 methyltransferase
MSRNPDVARTYVEVTITGEAGLLEHLVGLLSELGFEGFWEDGETLKGYISGERWVPGLQEEVERVVHLVMRPVVTTRPTVTVQSIQEKNWNAEWERTIRPIRVSDHITIRPTWQEYSAAPGEMVLVIDPKMSFGTGYHETTRLTLRLMERHVRPGISVLDVGTGTGVLAIAAVRMGASRAVGTDIDEWSSANARENVTLNGVVDRVTIHDGELDRLAPGRFSMVVANIQRGVLEGLLPSFALRLEPGGILLVSGLLDSDEEPMVDSLRMAGFGVIDRAQENEWIALVAGRAAER